MEARGFILTNSRAVYEGISLPRSVTLGPSIFKCFVASVFRLQLKVIYQQQCDRLCQAESAIWGGDGINNAHIDHLEEIQSYNLPFWALWVRSPCVRCSLLCQRCVDGKSRQLVKGTLYSVSHISTLLPSSTDVIIHAFLLTLVWFLHKMSSLVIEREVLGGLN